MDKDKQLQANKFEQFIYDFYAMKLFHPLSHFVTLDSQRLRGENHQGYEIKNDQRRIETKNVFISIKRVYYEGTKDEYEYGSGIYRETKVKQRYYIIGDQKCFYVFSTKLIRQYYEKRKPKLIAPEGMIINGGQEYGFILFKDEADRICCEKYDMEFEKQTELFDGAN